MSEVDIPERRSQRRNTGLKKSILPDSSTPNIVPRYVAFIPDLSITHYPGQLCLGCRSYEHFTATVNSAAFTYCPSQRCLPFIYYSVLPLRRIQKYPSLHELAPLRRNRNHVVSLPCCA